MRYVLCCVALLLVLGQLGCPFEVGPQDDSGVDNDNQQDAANADASSGEDLSTVDDAYASVACGPSICVPGKICVNWHAGFDAGPGPDGEDRGTSYSCQDKPDDCSMNDCHYDCQVDACTWEICGEYSGGWQHDQIVDCHGF